mgnify:CR=1 FL=1
MGLQYSRLTIREEFLEYTKCTHPPQCEQLPGMKQQALLVGIHVNECVRACVCVCVCCAYTGTLRELKNAWRTVRKRTPHLLLTRRSYHDVLRCKRANIQRQFACLDFEGNSYVWWLFQPLPCSPNALRLQTLFRA